MAATEASARNAAVLLGVYAAGFAIPFLAAALAFGATPKIVRMLSGRLAFLHSMSGAIVLALGVVLLLGIYERLFIELADLAPWRPWEPEI
jgi:cytochrome c-type biogenesis protein